MKNSQLDLASFAENVIKSSEFDNLEENFKNDMKEQIIAEANKRIGMMVISEMNEDEIKKYQDLLRKQGDAVQFEEASKYANEVIPELPKKIILTLKMYQDEFVSAANATKGQ